MSTVKPVLVFGETLFDTFPDGTTVLGGAPFNVAWNLKGFGLAPLFITARGNDNEGKTIQREMLRWGMDTSGVQTDARHPTGLVEITMQTYGDTPTHAFDILPDRAYDHIDGEKAIRAIAGKEFSLFYHGSLALRSPVARTAFERIHHEHTLPRFIDVNLRSPWYATDTVHAIIEGAAYVKLNDEELKILSGEDGDEDRESVTLAETFRRRYGIENLIVTMGERGALLVDSNGVMTCRPEAVAEVVDTVGAGDAFSSIAILGLTCGWSADLYMQRAVAFAARVCAIRGAVPRDLSFYKDSANEWGL